MLTHHNLSKLWSQGDSPKILGSLWEKRTGIDPIQIAVKIAKEQKDSRTSKVLAATCSCILVVVLFVGWMPYVNPGISREHLPLLAFPAFIFAIITASMALSELFEAKTRYTDAEWNFPGPYGFFLEWSGLTPAGINQHSENELRRVAKDILIKTAKEITTREAEDKRLRSIGSPGLGTALDEWRNHFKKQHAVLTDLYLIKNDYEYYHQEAGRQLANEKADSSSVVDTQAASTSAVTNRSANEIEIAIHYEDKLIERVITEKKRISIGRNSDNDIVLDNRGISRRHAMIKIHATSAVIIDNESLNGTLVNGRRIEEEILHDGDRIQIGKYALVFNPKKTGSPTTTTSTTHTVAS